MESAGVVLEDDDDEDDDSAEVLVGEFLEFLDNVRPEDFSG